jgi:hypothetical protein
MIRHCAEECNIDSGMKVIDATKIKHVIVVAGRIGHMSGFIDPATHLNFDFPDHQVGPCIIAQCFKVGAAVKFGHQGFVFATVSQDSFSHYGKIDYTQRLLDMIQSVRDINSIQRNNNDINNKNNTLQVARRRDQD